MLKILRTVWDNNYRQAVKSDFKVNFGKFKSVTNLIS